MKKISLIYSDLSNKALLELKEIYIQKKVDSMNNTELKKFVSDIITHQINDTIGKEEEMEAWKEMSDFFAEGFDDLIQKIQQKYQDNRKVEDSEADTQKQRLELLERNNIEKEDMWED
tara:strand:+ start:154 stop:507 length:354 start_codon:yes stop_codon:yes gene_type:complete